MKDRCQHYKKCGWWNLTDDCKHCDCYNCEHDCVWEDDYCNKDEEGV